jgi:RNA-splicing ligase RtcB
MLVPAVIYATEPLVRDMDEKMREQAIDVASHDLAAQGIVVRSPSSRGVAEEAPGAYKTSTRWWTRPTRPGWRARSLACGHPSA